MYILMGADSIVEKVKNFAVIYTVSRWLVVVARHSSVRRSTSPKSRILMFGIRDLYDAADCFTEDV